MNDIQHCNDMFVVVDDNNDSNDTHDGFVIVDGEWEVFNTEVS